MHPWNVGVVLQYSRKWWTIKVFQEWKQFTLLRWMKTKYFCERFQQPLTAHFGLNALLWCTSSDFFFNTEVDPSPFFSHWRVQGIFDERNLASTILNFCWNKLWKSFHHLLLFIIYKILGIWESCDNLLHKILKMVSKFCGMFLVHVYHVYNN